MLKSQYLLKVLCSICILFTINALTWAQDNVPFEITWGNKTVKIYKPLNISAVQYSDGGTIEIFVKDKWSNSLIFCLDARMDVRDLSDTKNTGIVVASVENYKHIYLGGYPKDLEAFKVDIGGKEEKQILVVLEDWLSTQVAKSELSKISSFVDHPRVMGLTEGEMSDAHVLTVIKKLRQRN